MSSPSRQSMFPGMEEPSAKEPRAARKRLGVSSSAVVENATSTASESVIGPTSVPNLAGKSVWTVDAHSLIFQVFHAIPEMSSPKGQAVNAVYGFTRDVLFLLETKRPDYFFCAFDMDGHTFRHELFAGYKKDRKEMPDDLPQQIELIYQVLAALSVPVIGLAGYEADDVLATLAQVTEERGGDCYVVTGDKDCRQLISDRVKVYNVRKNVVFDAAALAEEWGVRPDQVVDFQALVGDSVDSVPGVPGIGPTYAKQLLQQFGTLDAVLARAEEVTRPKLRQSLIDFREQALLSRKLVQLDRHVPIDIDWQRGLVRNFDVSRALDLFVELGFRGFANKIREQLKVGPAPVGHVSYVPDHVGESLRDSQSRLGETRPREGTPVEDADREQSGDEPDFAEHPAPKQGAPRQGAPPIPLPPAEWRADYRCITSLDDLATLAKQLNEQSRISIDTETTHPWPRWAALVGISFAWQEGEAYYAPIRAPEGEACLPQDKVLDLLRPALENPAIEKIGQNLKYDIIVLRAAGVNLAGPRFDGLVASHLIDAGQRRHGLDELSKRYLGHETIRIIDLIGRGKKQKRMDEVPLDQITPYAAEDADVPLRLRPILQQLLDRDERAELYASLEEPLIDVLADLEFTGIRIDPGRLGELSAQFAARIRELEVEIYRLAGREFNIASPKQLQEVLFRELKLPTRRRTSSSGPSTDANVLEDLALHHELPRKVLEYRQFAKLKGTYADALPQMIHPKTGRVHTSLNQDGAATGRLSSSDPNLQHIPIRTELGRAIRSAFLPGEPGWKLIAADYSQIELRILAHFSGDAALRAAFASDEDIHTRVASQVYNVPTERVTSEMRRSAKAVNFGIVYGQSPFGLAKQLRIDPDQAAEFIEAYYSRYPGVADFIARTLADCAADGYVSTIMGRRRAIHGVRPGARRQKNLPERTAVNTVIQGSAADLIKRAMIAVHRRLKEDRFAARLLLQIHDELLLDAPPEEIHAVAKMVEQEMSGCLPLEVPIKVDVAVGDNWAEVESWNRG